MKSHPLLFRTAVSSLLTTALVLALGGAAAAQLADGPWSMYHHDVCHTGQSPNLGPLFAGTPGTGDAGGHGRQDLARLRQAPDIAIAQRRRQDPLLRHGLRRSVPSTPRPWRRTACLHLPADVSDSSPAVGARRHDLHGRPRQLAERLHQHPGHQEAHAQVAVQPRARGGHLAASGHRPLERAARRAPSTSPTTSPPTGRASSPPSSTAGPCPGRPHGEVEVQDRQLRQAVFPGDRRERHHLLRRSERLCLRLRGQGRLHGQWHASPGAGADLFVQQRPEWARPAREKASRLRPRPHRVARHLRGFEHALHRAR